MSMLLDLITIAAICAGVISFLAGTLGVLRFPDPLTRLHAVAKADTLGLGFIVLGLTLHVRDPLESAKLILCWLIVLLASSVMGQLSGSMARKKAYEPEHRS